jgi:hypothetical protein
MTFRREDIYDDDGQQAILPPLVGDGFLAEIGLDVDSRDVDAHHRACAVVGVAQNGAGDIGS